MVKAIWNAFIANYNFLEKLLTDKGCNFKYQLVKELCKLAQIRNMQMTPDHSKTNGHMKDSTNLLSYQHDQ